MVPALVLPLLWATLFPLGGVVQGVVLLPLLFDDCKLDCNAASAAIRPVYSIISHVGFH